MHIAGVLNIVGIKIELTEKWCLSEQKHAFLDFFLAFYAMLRYATPRHVTVGAPNMFKIKIST
jgi:hypothetical protein